MIKSLQNCSITNTGSEVLLSAHFISVSSAVQDMDVMHKKVYGSYCSTFPWDAPRLLMTLFFCYWNISVVPAAMWNALMTLKERGQARGRNNCQSGTEVGLSCQAPCQRQCHTVVHPASDSSSKWGVFLGCFPSSRGGAQVQLALQAHPVSVISRSVTHVSSLLIKHDTPHLKQLR